MLDDHGAGRKVEVTRGREQDLAARGQHHPALLVGAVGPEGVVDLVGDRSGRPGAEVDGVDAAGRGQTRGQAGSGARGGGDELVDAALVIQRVELTVGGLGEGDEAAHAGVAEHDRSARRGDAREGAGVEVGVDQHAGDRGDGVAAVDDAGDDGGAADVAIPGDGVSEIGVGADVLTEAVGALLDVPAVVLAELDAVDLLPHVLADVAGPQVAGAAVEAEAPGVTQAPRVDLGPTAASGEGVVGGDRIGVTAVDVEAQHFTEQGVGVLGVALRVARAAAVAEAEVQKAIWPEGQVTAVMVAVGLVEREHQRLAGTIDRGAAVGAVEAGDDRLEDLAAGRVVRQE